MEPEPIAIRPAGFGWFVDCVTRDGFSREAKDCLLLAQGIGVR